LPAAAAASRQGTHPAGLDRSQEKVGKSLLGVGRKACASRTALADPVPFSGAQDWFSTAPVRTACVRTRAYDLGRRRIGHGLSPGPTRLDLPWKGGDPAAGSPTATLLRLHPSHQHRLGRLLPRRVGATSSADINSHGVTGGVYKARERIHRAMLLRDY